MGKLDQNLIFMNREDLICINKKIRKKKRFPVSLEKFLIVENLKEWRFNKQKVFSKKFEKMVVKCLSKNPKKSPTAKQLLKSSFFKKQRNVKKFKQFMLNAMEKTSTISRSYQRLNLQLYKYEEKFSELLD